MELDERTEEERTRMEGMGLNGDDGQQGEQPQGGPESDAGLDLICPECQAQGEERHFTGPRANQGLARHRSQVHGIKSKTQLLLEQRAAKKPRARAAKPRQERKPRMVKPELNEKALLKLVFPLGIPLDPALMEEATEWIATARGLYEAK